MGKKRREALEQKVENGEIQKKHVSPREWMKRMKEAFGDWGEDQREKVAMQARLKFMPRWMEECGVDDWHDIDYTNPQIHLEWILCDPGILRELTREGGRDKLFEMLTEEEKDVYLNKTDEKGAHYYDLEGKKGMTKKNIMKSVVIHKKV